MDTQEPRCIRGTIGNLITYICQKRNIDKGSLKTTYHLYEEDPLNAHYATVLPNGEELKFFVMEPARFNENEPLQDSKDISSDEFACHRWKNTAPGVWHALYYNCYWVCRGGCEGCFRGDKIPIIHKLDNSAPSNSYWTAPLSGSGVPEELITMYMLRRRAIAKESSGAILILVNY